MRLRYLVFLIIIVLGGISGGIILFGNANKPLPKELIEKLEFVVYVPTGNYSLDQKDIRYDENSKVLSMNIKSKEGFGINLNQQATPETFLDIPDYYPKLLEKLNEYSRVQTSMDTVHLTKPTELKGKQSAVVNYKGTLIFAQPERELSDDDWRKFFNSLEEVK